MLFLDVIGLVHNTESVITYLTEKICAVSLSNLSCARLGPLCSSAPQDTFFVVKFIGALKGRL